MRQSRKQSVPPRGLRVFRVIRGSFCLGSENTIHESHETHEDRELVLTAPTLMPLHHAM